MNERCCIAACQIPHLTYKQTKNEQYKEEVHSILCHDYNEGLTNINKHVCHLQHNHLDVMVASWPCEVTEILA